MSGRACVRLMLVAVVAALTVLALVPLRHSDARPSREHPVVRTDRGLVRGVTEQGYRVFRGVPFAQPPTGELRWRDPRPARAWTGIREATKPGPACAQTDAVGEYLPGSSEDCLYLNVTTPAAEGRRRPVLVWLHGGAWASGTGSEYDGRWLAGTGDAVVVTVNYRLGIFGFLGHPGLPGSGTYALADQQAALRWVGANARAFGGDPGNVTLIGQSAGGASVCAHLTSPTAAGLFHRAVIHSGSCLQNWPRDTMVPGTDAISYWASREDLQARGRAAAKAVGCGTGDQLRCLRAAPARKLMELNGRFGQAAFHTRLLPVDPRKALRLGLYHRIPVLQGNTRDEHRYFGPLFESDGAMDVAGYRSRLRRSFGAEAAARIEAVYPADRYPSVLAAWTAVVTDRSWVCPTLAANRLIMRLSPLYSFDFADRTAPRFADLFPPGYDAGAFHGADMPYLFDFGAHARLDPRQRQLSKTMLRYWSNFARTGDPNGPGLPHWPQYREGRTTLSLRLEQQARVDLTGQHHCGFWTAMIRR
ncbi:carboxylesterase family protein [Kribbella sp. NPDC023855]|uniref:carboxylesterase/lipase family protein n=1 Tax=Kribbella sp. NPDC023855 TaxID=3154698 RepID=UPI0033D260CB